MKFDAFISYSRKDILFASYLQISLEKNYINLGSDYRKLKTKIIIIIDESDFEIDENINNEIKSKIQQSKHLIVVCSKNTMGVKSKWVNDEINYFNEIRTTDSNRKIIPVLLDFEDEVKLSSLPDALAIAGQVPLGIKLTKNIISKNSTKLERKIYNEGLFKIYSKILDIPYSIIIDRHRKYSIQLKRKKILRTLTIATVILLSLAYVLIYATEFIIDSPEISKTRLEQGNFSTALKVSSPNIMMKGQTSGNILVFDNLILKDSLVGLEGLVTEIKSFDNCIIGASVDSPYVICWDSKSHKEKWRFNNPRESTIRSIEVDFKQGIILLGGDDGNIWLADLSGNLVDSLILDKEDLGKIMDIDLNISKNIAAICLNDFGVLLYDYVKRIPKSKIDLTKQNGIFETIIIKNDNIVISGMEKLDKHSYANGRLISINIVDGSKNKSALYEYTFDKLIPIPNSNYLFASDLGGNLRVIRCYDSIEISNTQVNPNLFGDGRWFGFDYDPELEKITLVNFFGELRTYKTSWRTIFNLKIPNYLAFK